MRKSRKVGYIGVDKAMLQSIRNKVHNITFFDIRNSKHKIFDIVIHTDSLSKEEKSLYELFNTKLINISNCSYNNIVSRLREALKIKRVLTKEQMLYIRAINKFQYINEEIESLVGEKDSHSLKVAYLAKEFCNKTNVSEEKTLELYMAGLFHDIGKKFVDPKILCKKGKLTSKEYDQIKIHPLKGYEMLKNYLPETILVLIRDHHTREDNSGYPKSEQATSEWTKILSLSDSYDAMISKRVYNVPLSKKEGINELVLCSKEVKEGGKGKAFNPYLTELFIKTL